MKIIVIDPRREDRELAVKYLSSAGHRVTSAVDCRAATTSIEAELPDVAVIDWETPQAAAFVKRTRAMELTSHLYVVGMSSCRLTTDFVDAINAGADDFIRKPIVREELVTRAGGIERIKRWAARIIGDSASAGTDLSSLRAWREADRSFTRDLEAVVGATLVSERCAMPLAGMVVGAEIPLTLAAEGLSVLVAIGFDERSMSALGSALLGVESPSPEMLADVCREMANTLSGAFRQAASEEGITLVTGLPSELDVKTLGRGASHQGFVIRPEDGSLAIGVHVEIRPPSILRATVATLTEGMVLVRDLLNEGGGMLIPGGTRLTQSHIQRIGRWLPEKHTLEVAQAA